MVSSKLQVVSVASLLGVGGSLAFMYLYRRRFSHLIWLSRMKQLLQKEKDIHIVSNFNQWERISTLFCSNAKSVSAVGFDCEWIQIQGKRRPVALMQLATHSGMCVLLRLNHLKENIPPAVRDILEDEEIAKVGVGTDSDMKYLLQDYNIRVNGWVDLRHLAVQNITRTSVKGEKVQEKLGLEALATKYLGRKLNKDWRVRMGDWEADTLANIQVNYAAEDALVGIHVLLCLLRDLRSPSSDSPLPPFRLSDWERITSKVLKDVCFPVRGIKFSQRSSADDHSSGKSREPVLTLAPKSLKKDRSYYSIRKSPLYHNSQLWAPDGEPLCTCDPRKAYWYVEKGLGDLVSESPQLVVRLRFEPAGRPNREGVDGQFYLQERHNLCVVCGKEDSYIRKNIIPHEYRKHFPEVLKSHQSHDVVLLCTDCHQKSNMKDTALRYTLASECSAPIGTEADVKLTIDGRLKAIRSAGGALKQSRNQLPPSRIAHLEQVLRDYFNSDIITQDLIDNAASLDTQVINSGYVPHGYKVFQCYKKQGLIRLETRWRQWFIDSMNPQFLPDNWSTTHNHKKLRIKMRRFPMDDPIRNEYKVALVGTEGDINVPYEPDMQFSSFFGLDADEESSREGSPEEVSAGSERQGL